MPRILVSLKPHRYQGRMLKVDDRFEARDEDVKLLKAIGRARELQPDEKPQRYKRRDMKAEE
jgi:hypothetical protein